MKPNIDDEIEEKFGEEKLKEAVARLCQKCNRADDIDPLNWRNTGCLLIPLTSDGSDCPYFKQGE